MGMEIMIALGALVVVALAAIAFAFLRTGDRPNEPAKLKSPGPAPTSSTDDSAPVSSDQAAALTMPGGSPIRVDRTQFRIGRASKDGPQPHLDLGPFAGKYGSRNHALIFLDTSSRQWKIRDLGSMNGTFVNERQLRPNEDQVLRHRDRISFTDRFEVVFEHASSGDSMPGVGSYHLIELVAKGGMAGVYKARATNEELVAIKVPLDYGEDTKLSLMRLQDEFDILNRIRSSRCARAVEFTRCSDGRPAMIMEFLFGQTLRNYLQKSPVSPVDSIHIGLSIAEGLAALHNLDRVHCDLKPDNVMMRKPANTPMEIAQHAVVIDFGIAMQNRTTMKNVFGSANYQSPEHILGQQLTLKADVYSLGCMLYEMIANSRLYPDAQEVKQIKEFQVNRMPLNVSEQAAQQGRKVPDELAKMVMLMLEKSPNVRPDLQTVMNQLNGMRSRYSSQDMGVSRG